MRKFDITGMSCAACSARVERACSSLSGVESCSVNLLTNSMTIEGDAGDDVIIDAVVKAGYGASLHGAKNVKKDNKGLQNNAKNTVLTRLIVSACLLIPLMYVSMGHVMWGAPLPALLSENPIAIALVELLICAIVMVINQKFFINGARGVLSGAPNMDTLVAIGSFASFAYSTVLVFAMSADYVAGDTALAAHRLHEMYFESAAMILVLITVGKFLEERAKGKTTDAIRSLMELSPKTATVIRDGKEVVIDSAEVVVGDILVLRPGESIAADGVVIEGVGEVNEAALTGESVPKDKRVGDRLLAGSVNGSGFLKYRATEVGEATTLSSVIKMVDDAAASKAPIAKIADKVSGVFVPIVMLIALVTFAVWWAVSGGFAHALERGISVLVISCPCALGLATPVAIMVGSGVGARLGILFKSAEAIELSGKAKNVAIDKTGTLTTGKMQVVELVVADGSSESELLSVALSLEQYSEHPLARAVVEYAQGRAASQRTTDFVSMTGSGVSASLDGERIVGARYSYVQGVATIPEKISVEYNRLASDGKTPLVFLRGERVLGIIAIADTLRADSAEAVAALRALGLRVVMLTGDNSLVAQRIGSECGVDEVHAQLLPADKEREIRRLSSEGGVIMIGDGINDAPSLARADVGMAIGGGTDIAIDSADVVLMRESLSDCARAVRLGRATYRNICQNLFWAFIYNGIGIPLAAGAFSALLGWEMTPMLGALAMSLSSFCVVSNALRLNTFAYSERKRENKKHENKSNESEKRNMSVTLKIEGMMCPHCEARVKSCIEAVAGVKSAAVSHKEGTAVVDMEAACDVSAVKSAVEAAGYPVLEIN